MEIQETIKTILGNYFQAQGKGDCEGMSRAFQELVGARNYFAVSKGFSNFLDFQKEFHHIPKDHWQKYLSNRDLFATSFSPRLEITSNSPHFLSKITEVDIHYPEGVFDYVSQKYPEMIDLENKITLSELGTGADYKYSKEEDHFFIIIPKTNHNQQISMLIHELAHVINQEKFHHQIPNTYTDELEAHRVEFSLVRAISDNFFRAVIGEYLMCFVRTDFQIALFNNPDQDQSSLYTKIFEKYVGNLDLQNDTDYLSDKKLIFSPLIDLPVAVALVNILT